MTFEHLAREWYGINKPHWTSTHAYDVIHTLERDVFPQLGSRDIRTITVPEVLEVLREIEDRPAIETAKRVRQCMSAVFVHAIACGIGENDSAAIVQKALKPLKKGLHPAITDLEQAREIIRRVDETPANPATKLALRLLALTAVRPGTLITTPWSEFADLDADTPIWRLPAARMKLKLAYKDDASRDHFVPLGKQAIETIELLRSLSGRAPYVLPNGRNAHKPASENALGYLLNRAGYHQQHVPHGWRATFSSVMNERFKADRQIIDLMLAHSDADQEWLVEVIAEIAEYAFLAGRHMQEAWGKPFEGHAVRGIKTLQSAAEGGAKRKGKLAPDTPKIVAYMQQQINAGKSQSEAASHAKAKGLGSSKGNNLRLYKRMKRSKS